MSERYQNSERLLARARKTIPLGAQTFSKSVTQFPFGVSPYFAVKGEGALLWDADGNVYLDFINALAAVNLGYCDPDVNAAVAEQLKNGSLFSLSHALEATVAEKIVDMVPCAEMVRFAKNGSDATAGAVRLARAVTGRDHVMVCGYHGWQDWYIGTTTRDRGVPADVAKLSRKFPFNDLAACERMVGELKGQVAAIILEPMNIEAPTPAFLGGLRELCTREKIVLVFDETITGFRFANGGAQEKFGVVPDLTTLGKGLANGFPLAAVCGRADLMHAMTEIFFSFTMGGETLSLAAANAVLDKMKREPVVATMRARGEEIVRGLEALLAKHGAGGFARVAGDPTWSFLLVSDAPHATSFELKTLLLQEMFARGVLTLGTHNMSYAHGSQDVATLLRVYDEVLPLLVQSAQDGRVRERLKCDPLEPLFKVR